MAEHAPDNMHLDPVPRPVTSTLSNRQPARTRPSTFRSLRVPADGTPAQPRYRLHGNSPRTPVRVSDAPVRERAACRRGQQRGSCQCQSYECCGIDWERDSVHSRLAVFGTAGAAAVVLGLCAGAPQAFNRDDPSMVVMTVVLGLACPITAAGLAWVALQSSALPFRWVLRAAVPGAVRAHSVVYAREVDIAQHACGWCGHSAPLMASALLCLVVSQVTGHLLADSAFARSVFEVRRLDVGVPLREAGALFHGSVKVQVRCQRGLKREQQRRHG